MGAFPFGRAYERACQRVARSVADPQGDNEGGLRDTAESGNLLLIEDGFNAIVGIGREPGEQRVNLFARCGVGGIMPCSAGQTPVTSVVWLG